MPTYYHPLCDQNRAEVRSFLAKRAEADFFHQYHALKTRQRVREIPRAVPLQVNDKSRQNGEGNCTDLCAKEGFFANLRENLHRDGQRD